MFASQHHTTRCTMDGMMLALTFYPDTGLVRICDDDGHCLRETWWPDTWPTLLDSLHAVSDAQRAVRTRIPIPLAARPSAATQAALA